AQSTRKLAFPGRAGTGGDEPPAGPRPGGALGRRGRRGSQQVRRAGLNRFRDHPGFVDHGLTTVEAGRVRKGWYEFSCSSFSAAVGLNEAREQWEQRLPLAPPRARPQGRLPVPTATAPAEVA